MAVTIAKEPFPFNPFDVQTYSIELEYYLAMWQLLENGIHAAYLDNFPNLRGQVLLVLDRSIARKILTAPELGIGVFDLRFIRQQMSEILAKTLNWNPFLAPEIVSPGSSDIAHSYVRHEMEKALHTADRLPQAINEEAEIFAQRLLGLKEFDIVHECLRYSAACMMKYLGLPREFLSLFCEFSRDLSYLADYSIDQAHQAKADNAAKIFWYALEGLLQEGHLKGVMESHIDQEIKGNDLLALVFQLQILGVENAASTLESAIVELINAQMHISPQKAKYAVRAAVKVNPTLNYILRTVAPYSGGYLLDDNTILPPYTQIVVVPFILNNPTQKDAAFRVGPMYDVYNYGHHNPEDKLQDRHFCPGKPLGEQIAQIGLSALLSHNMLNRMVVHEPIPFDGTFFRMPLSRAADLV